MPNLCLFSAFGKRLVNRGPGVFLDYDLGGLPGQARHFDKLKTRCPVTSQFTVTPLYASGIGRTVADTPVRTCSTEESRRRSLQLPEGISARCITRISTGPFSALKSKPRSW